MGARAREFFYDPIDEAHLPAHLRGNTSGDWQKMADLQAEEVQEIKDVEENVQTKA